MDTNTLDHVTATEIENIDAALGSLDLDLGLDLATLGTDEAVVDVTDEEILEAAAEPVAEEVIEERVEEVLELTATEIAVTEITPEPEPEVEAAADAEPDPLAELDMALELNDSDMSAIEAEAAKEEAYAQMTEGATSSDVADTTASKPAKAAKEKTPKEPKEKKERAPRDLASLAPENFVLELSNEPDDLEANKAAVIASAPSQKKIAEKFENIILALSQGRAPSVYTMDCFEVLAAKGEVTSTDLVAALRAKKRKDGSTGYSEGTARSQTGQIMALFPILKIATRDKQTLKLNEDSVFAAAMKEMIGAGA